MRRSYLQREEAVESADERKDLDKHSCRDAGWSTVLVASKWETLPKQASYACRVLSWIRTAPT